jgi:hypothetical protein
MLQKLLILLLTLFPKEESTFTKEYIIPTEQIPLNIYWISEDNILLSYLNKGEIFNLENRKRNILEECKNCIYGYGRELLKCEYEHRDIQSMDEFSTTISLYDSTNTLIFKKDIFPTVIPTVCKKEYIVLKNAYSFLEKKTYYLDIKKDNLEEVNNLKREISIPNLPKYKNIAIGEERVILLTEENFLAVYKRGR